MSSLSSEEIDDVQKIDDVIVDFQYFFDGNEKLIIKEITFLAFDDFELPIFTYLFEPTCDEQCFDEDIQKKNRELTKKFHRIAWKAGIEKFDQTEEIVCFYTQNYRDIFASGAEKVKHLQSILNRNVKNIDNFLSESWREESVQQVRCPNHQKFTKHCSVKNALKIRSALGKDRYRERGDLIGSIPDVPVMFF